MTIEKRGIFALFDVTERQYASEWSVKSDVWINTFIPTPNTGYFANGSTGSSIVSTVDRIDYSNDTATASIKGPLSGNRYNSRAATSNSSYGWFGGGRNPAATPDTVLSTVDRIDYANDTATASVKGPLSIIRYALAATGNSSYGWFGGGGPGTLSSVDRIDYANDTATASPKGPLGIGYFNSAATGNASYGWFASGNFPKTTVISRIDYSNDTATASIRGPLSSEREQLAGTGNDSYGWFSSTSVVTSVDRIDYSNDTATASVRGPLSNIFSTYGRGATGNTNFGYFAGGVSPAVSIVERIDYSNDTAAASPKGPLSSPRYRMAATSARVSGLPSATSSIINFGTGVAESPSVVANVPVEIIPSSRYGYFSSGFSPESTVDRIDYSNDTATASSKGSVSTRGSLAATGNSSYGYFGGGRVSNNVFSTVERIDYSNDTATASPKGPLSGVRIELAATGNSSYGYFSGGFAGMFTTYPPGSTILRIDYSNDTATASVRAPLTHQATNLAATGNSSFGYFGGGRGNDGSTASRVQRIDYSNDTVNASVKGPLSSARYRFAATGNSSYGWFGGGRDGGGSTVSTVDRIDYSNDTATASPKGTLSSVREGSAATGNSSYGYFGGGGFPTASTVDRIEYSNDTATASIKGPLNYVRYGLAASSAGANGLPQ